MSATGLFIAVPMVDGWAPCTDLPRRPESWVRGRGFTTGDLAALVAEVDKGNGVSWSLPPVEDTDTSQPEPPTVTLAHDPARCFPPAALRVRPTVRRSQH